MNYKIYYKTNGRITGILESSDLEKLQTTYESSIEYDLTIDIESEETPEIVFFDYHISDGNLVEGKHSEQISEFNLKLVRNERKNEYPPIGDQLDALFHAGVFPEEMTSRIQSIKDKYPKA